MRHRIVQHLLSFGNAGDERAHHLLAHTQGLDVQHGELVVRGHTDKYQLAVHLQHVHVLLHVEVCGYRADDDTETVAEFFHLCGIVHIYIPHGTHAKGIGTFLITDVEHRDFRTERYGILYGQMSQSTEPSDGYLVSLFYACEP